jgi:hypothetical protein
MKGIMDSIASSNSRTSENELDSVSTKTLNHWPRARDVDYHDEDPDRPVISRRMRLLVVALSAMFAGA